MTRKSSNPLPPEVAAFRGLSPQRRDELVAQAASVAMRFTWAVKARNAAEVQRIAAFAAEAAGEDLPFLLWALAIVLAEGEQPGSFRLLEVTDAARKTAARGEGAA